MSARSRPATETWPVVASISLISRRMIVDLPEPLAPTMKTNSPGWVANVAPFRPWSPAKPGREQRRRSLTYFAQLSDFQLADEESPARVEVLDGVNSFFGAAWRPQEALMPYTIDASIRQVDSHLRSPFKQGNGKRAS